LRRKSCAPDHPLRQTTVLLAARNRLPISSRRWASWKKKRTKLYSGWSCLRNPNSLEQRSWQRSNKKPTNWSPSPSHLSKRRVAIASEIPHSEFRIPNSN